MSAPVHAWMSGEDTGEIYVPPHQRPPARVDPLVARPWPLYIASGAFVLCAVPVFLCYAFFVHIDAPLATRISFVALTAVLLAAGVIMLAAGLVVRAVGRLLLRQKCSLKRHMDLVAEQRLAGLARLTTLDDDMRTRVEALGRGNMALIEEACRRMGQRVDGLGGELTRVREIFESRLEQRVEQARIDPEVIGAAIDEATQRAWWRGYAQSARDLTSNGHGDVDGNGKVVRLPPQS